jgi:membrane protease YdiL (CAAX protease family)
MNPASFIDADRSIRDTMLEGFTIYLSILTASMLWALFDLPGGRWLAMPLALGATIGLIFWPVWRGARFGDAMRVIGLHAGSPGGWMGLAREVLMGMVGYIALLPLVVMAVVVTALLSRFASADPSHPVVDALTGPPIVLVVVFLLAVVWAPVTEEVFFRGMFFGHAASRIPWPVAGIVTGTVFAMIHPQGWTAIPVLTTIGFNFAVIRHWRGGSLIGPIAAHALNNGAVITFVVTLLR